MAQGRRRATAFLLSLAAAAWVAPAEAAEPWCVEGLASLEDGVCYLLPPGATRLVVYLHGIIPPTDTSPQKVNLEAAIFRAATRAGYAVLFPRGVRGIGPGDHRDYWAWPTRTVDYERHAAGMVSAWGRAKEHLESMAGHPFPRTYYAGSSNGAYFLCSLVFRGALAADGFAALSGGSAGIWSPARIGAMTSRPFFVAYGIDDPTSGDPQSLAVLLRDAHWITASRRHPGGHGAREVYLDEAFAFWETNATGTPAP